LRVQEHVTDAQSHSLVVGDDDLDLIHVGHCRGRSIDGARIYGSAQAVEVVTDARVSEPRVRRRGHQAVTHLCQ
jgi:hypothetical protein